MTMLTKDALEFLADKFGPDPASRIITAPAEPKDRYYVLNADGSMVKCIADSPPANHAAASLETLVAWAKNKTEAIIWYSRKGVVASDKPGDPHEDRCHFDLAPSPQLAYLIGIAGESNGRNFDQSSFIRLLRTTLYGSAPDALLDAVRKVNLQKGKTVAAEQTKGKVSLNRSDIAEMSGAAAIPDVVQFDVPIFSAGNMGVHALIQCDLDLNAETERFVLTVLPGQIEDAWTQGESNIRSQIFDLLDEVEMPVYLGTP